MRRERRRFEANAMTMKTAYCLSIIAALVLFAKRGTAREGWSPAYDDAQLDLINTALEKWKPDLKYPAVKDIFKGRTYEPNWKLVDEKANIWDQVTDSFKNEREAIRAGCQCDFIKSTTAKTCLLKRAASQGAWVLVYDQDTTGKFIKNSVITPPTWYDFASVQLVDIFGSGRPQFILIEHQGDHGTGRDEKIHWIVGWDGKAFRTVLRETVLWEQLCG